MRLARVVFEDRAKRIITFTNEEDFVISIKINYDEELGWFVCPQKLRVTNEYPERTQDTWARLLAGKITNLDITEYTYLCSMLIEILPHLN